MNEENKNTVNATNDNNLEMPAMVNNVVKPIPVSEQPTQPESVPQQSAPVVNPVQAEVQAPTPQPTEVVPTPAPAQEVQQKEVGTVVVGKPMSNIIKPIPVGDMQGVGPVATVGGANETAPKKKNNIVAVIILIVGIVFLIGYVLFTYVLKDKIGNSGLTGTTKNGYLVYSDPKKGDKINFELSDTLKLIVTIDELETQENIGVKASCSIKEADGTDTVAINDLWLTDDNALNIGYYKVGNYAVIRDDSSTSNVNVIGFDGKVVKLNELSSYINEESGLTVKFSSVLDDKIEIQGSRVDSNDNIKYGSVVTSVDYTTLSEEEQEKYSRYILGEGYNMCVDEYSKIPETATISALFTFSIKDGKIDFNTPEVTEKTDFKTYYESNKDLLCQ